MIYNNADNHLSLRQDLRRLDDRQRLHGPSAYAAARPTRSTQEAPSHEAIAARAYELYVASGCEDGRCDEHWHQAEQDLRGEFEE